MVEKKVAFFLGSLVREFYRGALGERDIGNADETHFVIIVDNGITLGFHGEQVVKYLYVTFDGEGMTMMVRISGGPEAVLQISMMIFKNKDSNYPIRFLQYNVPAVCFRAVPKGWMSKLTMLKWVSENRTLPKLPDRRRRVLFMGNWISHGMMEDLRKALNTNNTYLTFLPPKAVFSEACNGRS